MNLDPVRPLRPAPHPDITVLARIPYTVAGLSWRHVLAETQARLELGILRTLQPSPWTIIDGDIRWDIDIDRDKRWVILIGVWQQR